MNALSSLPINRGNYHEHEYLLDLCVAPGSYTLINRGQVSL